MIHWDVGLDYQLPNVWVEAIRTCRASVDKIALQAWEEIAGAAWKFHSSSGRGVVVLDLNDIAKTILSGDAIYNLTYDRAEDVHRYPLDAPAAKVVADTLRDYIPETAVLVRAAFRFSEMTLHVVREASHWPPPPMVYARQNN